jgi:BED zinc finger
MEKYPDIIQTFYSDCQVVDISRDKSSFKGNCNKCKKTITGGWKPAKVTSNFISHVKVCID